MTAVELSVVIPVTERVGDVEPLFEAYRAAVAAMGRPFEFVYVLDGQYPGVLEALRRLKAGGAPIRVIALAKSFGEATALSAGVANASGELILTLPAYRQVAPGEIPRLMAELGDHDVVVARRSSGSNAFLNRVQNRAFHGLLRLMVETPFHDLGCGVRLFRRRVLTDLDVYGDQHRFLPLLAYHRGFDVAEIALSRAPEDSASRVYPFGIYVRRALDILATAFILKFTQKPLRFFGLIGSALFAFGAAMFVWMAVQKFVFLVAMGDRPLLIVSTLLMVLAVQIVAIGLVGELIIFMRGKQLRPYAVDEIVEHRQREDADADGAVVADGGQRSTMLARLRLAAAVPKLRAP
jgi:glycosyltransferase involved in cell wall biosynthesis